MRDASEAVECRDLAEARALAITCIRQILKTEAGAGRPLTGRKVVIRDANGNALLAVPFSAALQ